MVQTVARARDVLPRAGVLGERRCGAADLASGGPPSPEPACSASYQVAESRLLLGREHERQQPEQSLAQPRSGISATLALAGS